MDEYARRELAEAIRYVTMAPSTHNSQPWKFAISEEVIRIFPDTSRSLLLPAGWCAQALPKGTRQTLKTTRLARNSIV